MKTRILIAIVAVALGVGASFTLSQKPAAPDVAFTTLQGQTFRTADLRGKVVLVNFWATTCTTCIKEMPMLVRTHEKFAARGFETLAVAMDYDPPAQVKAYAERAGLPFTITLDSRGEAARAFDGVRLTPTTFLIDKRGNIVQKYLGEPDADKLHALVESLLNEPA